MAASFNRASNILVCYCWRFLNRYECLVVLKVVLDLLVDVEHVVEDNEWESETLTNKPNGERVSFLNSVTRHVTSVMRHAYGAHGPGPRMASGRKSGKCDDSSA